MKTQEEEESGMTLKDPNPILTAARRGDVKELTSLLSETKSGEPFTCPKDWEYGFDELVRCDHNMQSPLHLAAAIGNHQTAFECVEILLENDQMILDDPVYGDYEKKSKYLIDLKDKYGETALHVAIENKAVRVVAYLIGKKAAVTLKSKDGVPALTLVYQKVPDAMREIYEDSIEISEDFKKLHLNFGSIIGYHHTIKDFGGGTGETEEQDERVKNSSEFQKIPIHEFEQKDLEYWKETEYLYLILKADKWGAILLQHSLVKYFLELKWKKIQPFFYTSFLFHSIWFLLYAVAFVDLHLKVDGDKNKTGNCPPEIGGSIQCESHEDPRICYGLWYFVLSLTLLILAKEVYQCWSLRLTYLSFENCAQVLFIFFFIIQFGFLLVGHAKIVASISVIGILLSTICMICQLGKTPFFGLQVAALTRVVYSCKPHICLFIVWFFGFGLSFWSLFYKSDEFSILRMPAIITGMAAGELNMGDLMEKVQTESWSLQIFSVICLVVFIIVIVTLYLNLLIGYAVSDIQLLKTKAEVLDLSNRLGTIYTIESFLLSHIGQKILHAMSVVKSFCKKVDLSNTETDESPFDCLYVIPPEKFKKSSGQYEVKFEDIPEKIIGPLKEIAYNNLLKDE